MLVFPQLSTGASGQFPLTRSKTKRTIVNSLADGSVVRYLDDWGEVAWDLDLRELTSEERNAIESLFNQTEGRLRPFTFLDPADNLLRFSESLTTEAWALDPLLGVTERVTDPLGTARASRLSNGGQGDQGISQCLDVPANFVYCWSVWVRGTGTVRLASSSVERTFNASAAWKRLTLTRRSSELGAAVTFRLDLSPAAVVDVFGFQLEAQPGASGYKMTGTRGGVYSGARFASNELWITAEGLDRDRARLRIVAVTGS